MGWLGGVMFGGGGDRSGFIAAYEVFLDVCCFRRLSLPRFVASNVYRFLGLSLPTFIAS